MAVAHPDTIALSYPSNCRIADLVLGYHYNEDWLDWSRVQINEQHPVRGLSIPAIFRPSNLQLLERVSPFSDGVPVILDWRCGRQWGNANAAAQVSEGHSKRRCHDRFDREERLRDIEVFEGAERLTSELELKHLTSRQIELVRESMIYFQRKQSELPSLEREGLNVNAAIRRQLDRARYGYPWLFLMAARYDPSKLGLRFRYNRSRDLSPDYRLGTVFRSAAFLDFEDRSLAMLVPLSIHSQFNG